MDANYLNLRLFSDNYSFAPAFGDLDNDGDLDILVGEIFTSSSTLRIQPPTGNPLAFTTGSTDTWASTSTS
ncbi:MAG: hypothetical protein H6559_34690 [Lewinellaceae bacterium]|nr:hypothetical protein [Lewinellaceae bacterium]